MPTQLKYVKSSRSHVVTKGPRPVPDKQKAVIEPLDEVATLVTTSSGERG